MSDRTLSSARSKLRMVTSILMAMVAAGGSLSCQDHDFVSGPRLLASVVTDTTNVPAADTYIIGSNPGHNIGPGNNLRIKQPDLRALIRFDQASIGSVVGSDSLVSAVLRFSIIGLTSDWGPSGRYVDIHRMTHGWTENGATWNCASSTHTCPGGDQWVMGLPESSRPFVSTPTSSQLITTAQSGVVEFDVTADVRAFLAGTTNHGWLLKRANEVDSGKVDFHSKENTAKPRLVLTVLQGDTSRPSLPASFAAPKDSTGLGLLHVTGSQTRYYPHLIGIRFDDSTSGVTIRGLLERYTATIVGGRPNIQKYVVQVPPAASLEALKNRLDSLNSEPGVRNATPIAWASDVTIDGRYPDDGTTRTRSHWFASTMNDHARTRWAVRAPLAWSCENGTYSTARVRVGVADFYFSASHPDLAGNFRRVATPEQFLSYQSAPTQTGIEHHGTAVIGMIAARGDNGQGTAGMMWNVDAFGYLMSDLALPGVSGVSVGDIPGFLTDYLFKVAADSQVRVLSLSIGVNVEAKFPSVADDLVDGIRQYVQAGGVLVISAGNSNTTNKNLAALAQWPSTISSGSYPALLVAAARVAQTSDSGGVLVVSATDATDEGRQSNSNYFQGLSRLAAPGTSVPSLANDSLGVTVGSYSETSIAAPMVAGIAAQLLAFDPTLSPAQVRDYLIRGSREQRLGNSGGLDTVPDIDEMAGVKMVDAYGSLSLLSRERASAPLCAIDVYPGSTGDGLVAEWLSGTRTIELEEGVGAFGHVSVARGGRKVSITGTEQGSSTIVNHVGELLLGFGDSARFYLERDSVDIKRTQNHLYLATVRGASFPSGQTFDFFSSVFSAGQTRIYVAPSAQYAIARYGTQSTCELFDNAGIAALPSTALSTVTSVDVGGDCPTGPQGLITGVNWSNDSRNAVVTISSQSLSGAVSTTWVRVSPPSTVHTSTGATGVYGTQTRFVTDSILASFELDSSFEVCTRRLRRMTTMEQVGSATQVGINRCWEDWYSFTAPPARLDASPHTGLGRLISRRSAQNPFAGPRSRPPSTRQLQ